MTISMRKQVLIKLGQANAMLLALENYTFQIQISAKELLTIGNWTINGFLNILVGVTSAQKGIQTIHSANNDIL